MQLEEHLQETFDCNPTYKTDAIGIAPTNYDAIGIAPATSKKCMHMTNAISLWNL
jgi:hypothetical protein